MNRTIGLVFSFLVAGVAGCQHTERFDLVIINAHIWTGDPAKPEASALAVRNGRFIYVGSDSPLQKAVGAHAHVVDAHGARIIPGMIDSHIHLVSGGLQLMRLNLRDVPDRSAFISAVAARAKATPRGEWILGGRWSTESWTEPVQQMKEGVDSTQPTKEWIDPVTANIPVLLSRMDGHGALANSIALRKAGITRDGPADPLGGKIERDPLTNEPTGILKDTAIDVVEQIIPKPPDRQLDEALANAIRETHRHGLTGVDTMSEWSDLAVLDRARKSGKLNLRVRMFVMEDEWAPYVENVKHHRDDEWLSIRGFKGYMDGSLGSRSAYMTESFSDQPGNRGLLRQPDQAKLEAMCCVAVGAGYAPTFHAIGDQANHRILDAYDVVSRVSRPARAPAATRPRIEHAQHLLPDDIPRFAQLGVVASMQPYHKADDGRYAEKAIGAERCKTSYAFRSLLDSGAHLAFGSDWPVVSLNPFLGIHAAVTGRTLDGKVFVPEQNITLDEALRGYTSGAAYASGDEDRMGMIKAGYLADFVILDEDPFAIPSDRLGEIQVHQTFVGGKEVWNSSREKK